MWCRMERPINIVSILFGIFFVLVGCMLIFYNEDRNVNQIKKALEASQEYVEVDSNEVLEENEDKLVTMIGTLSFDEASLVDPEFGISAPGTMYLRREVEVCQYQEVKKRDKLFHEYYDYELVWSRDYIDGSKFHAEGYNNPKPPYETKTFYANNVKVGAYKLEKDEYTLLTNEQVVKIDSNKKFKGTYTVFDNYIMSGDSMVNPKLGDIRIRYYYNVNSLVSVFARQHDGYITEYITKNGESINYLIGGRMEASTFVNTIRYEVNDSVFFTRVICFIFNALGFVLILSPFYKSFSNLKIFGKLVGKSVNIAAASFGVAVSLFILALPWLFYKPLFSILFFAIDIVIMLFISSMFFQETDPFHVKVSEELPFGYQDNSVVPIDNGGHFLKEKKSFIREEVERKEDIPSNDGLNSELSVDDVFKSDLPVKKMKKVKIIQKTTKIVDGKKKVIRKVVGTKMVPVGNEKKDS